MSPTTACSVSGGPKALGLVVLASCFPGCFQEPLYEDLLCSATSICPSGYACGDDARCHQRCSHDDECNAQMEQHCRDGVCSLAMTSRVGGVPGGASEDPPPAALQGPSQDAGGTGDGASPGPTSSLPGTACSTQADCTAPGPCELLDGTVRCSDRTCAYAAKTCTTPPPPECVENDSVYRVYAVSGSCTPPNGACEYAAVDLSCPACQSSCLDPCRGAQCDAPPNECFVATGTCNPTDRSCAYALRASGSACSDDGNPCTRDVCDGAGACTHLARVGTACNDGLSCTYSDACDASGRCTGTVLTCASDSCTTRTCDGTPSCSVNRLGRPVYETYSGGWDYNQNAQGTLVYRVPIEDRTTYLLSSPDISDRLQTLDQNEANTCDWCGCAVSCAFSNTGRTIGVSATQAPGMVPLYGWVQPTPSIQHRSGLTSPGAGWSDDRLLGFVCAP